MKWLLSISMILLLAYPSEQSYKLYIKYSEHGFQAGDTLHYLQIIPSNTLLHGEAGAEVNWNFSQFQTDDRNMTIIYIEEVPAANHFLQKANIQMKIKKDGIESMVYYLLNSQSLSIVGVGRWNQQEDVIFEYDDPLEEMIYPFYYGDQFEDNYSYSLHFNESGEFLRMKIDGVATTKADGYGSLNVSSVGYEKVLRTKSVINETIQTYLNNKLVSTSESANVTYKWYTQNLRYCLLELTQDKNGNMSGNLLTRYPDKNPVGSSPNTD